MELIMEGIQLNIRLRFLGKKNNEIYILTNHVAWYKKDGKWVEKKPLKGIHHIGYLKWTCNGLFNYWSGF